MIQHSWLKTHKQLIVADCCSQEKSFSGCRVTTGVSHLLTVRLTTLCVCVCVHVCVTLQAEKTDKEKQVCLFIITSTLLLFCFSLLSLRILCTQHILEAQNIFLPSVQPFKGPLLCKFSDLLCFIMTSTGATLHRRKNKPQQKISRKTNYLAACLQPPAKMLDLVSCWSWCSVC